MKLEKKIDDFFKLYYKIEELSLDNAIKCLTTNEIHIINEIAEKTMTINDLSEKLSLTMGTVSIAISKLEKKSFVVRSKSSEDKRKVFISLSDKGKIAYSYHGNFQNTVIDRITKNIDKKKFEVFLSVFDKMYENLCVLKKEYDPVTLDDLSKGDTAIICEVRVSNVFFKHLLGREIKVLAINFEEMSIGIGKVEKKITKEEAQNIICVKKGKK